MFGNKTCMRKTNCTKHVHCTSSTIDLKHHRIEKTVILLVASVVLVIVIFTVFHSNRWAPASTSYHCLLPHFLGVFSSEQIFLCPSNSQVFTFIALLFWQEMFSWTSLPFSNTNAIYGDRRNRSTMDRCWFFCVDLFHTSFFCHISWRAYNNNNNHDSTALYGSGPPLASSFRGY